jgi:hypothetical protein
MEPCINGLLERFEGLVLLGLGPPAISSLSSRCGGGRGGNKERRVEGGEAGGRGCQKRQDRVSTAGGRRGRGSLGVKQLRNVVMRRPTFSRRRREGVIAREQAGDWRVAQAHTG